jgi:hypothetical protein
MLAFARPYFKAGEKTDKEFSHYENYYKCSRCGYEIHGRKEGEHEPDQDAGDDEENGDDEDEPTRDQVDSWQRRRDLKT